MRVNVRSESILLSRTLSQMSAWCCDSRLADIYWPGKGDLKSGEDMVNAVTRFQTRDGKVYDTEEDANLAESRIDVADAAKLLERPNAQYWEGEIINKLSVLGDIVDFIIGNNIHKSKDTMQHFANLIRGLAAEEGE